MQVLKKTFNGNVQLTGNDKREDQFRAREAWVSIPRILIYETDGVELRTK